MVNLQAMCEDEGVNLSLCEATPRRFVWALDREERFKVLNLVLKKTGHAPEQRKCTHQQRTPLPLLMCQL